MLPRVDFGTVEVGPTSAAPVCVIVSQKITGLTVKGTTATVTAIGFYNGVLSTLTVVAVAGTPKTSPPGAFSISAVPQNGNPGYYQPPLPASGGTQPQAPLVSGSLVVFGGTSETEEYTDGSGTIPVRGDMGVFNFSATETEIDNVVLQYGGSLNYTEVARLGANTIVSTISKLVTRIYFPAVTSLSIGLGGHSATFGGTGYFNGIYGATITVNVLGNGPPGILTGATGQFVLQPAFSIEATDSNGNVLYTTGGTPPIPIPLSTGYIVIYPGPPKGPQPL